ncbi:MAG: Gfo/Idh/MocA family oxidoreductase [Phycisphaerae bacterium]
MNPLRFVLVGTGNIAGTYAAAVEKVDEAAIVGVVSRDAARAGGFIRENGLDAEAATALGAARADFDAVILATPNGLHHQGAIEAARLGKHVLSEKPLDVTAERMDRMIAACRDAGVRLGTAYFRRTRENNRIVKRMLDDGAFGRVYGADLSLKVYRPQDYYEGGAWRGTWDLDGGGPFMQQGSHDIDLACWLLGRPTAAVAMTGTFGHTGIEVEDHGAAALELAGGGILSVVASTVVQPGFPPRLDLFAERGSLSMENDRITFWGMEGMENPGAAPEGEQHSAAAGAAVKDTSGHEAVLRDFVEAVREDRPPLVPPESARVATDVILAIYRAAAEGRKVEVAG